MARKTLNRTELRRQNEAAEAAEKEKADKDGGEATTVPKKKKKRKAAKRKSRAKTAVDARMRLFWGVYNQSLKLVAKYEYHQKKHAQKKAEELSEAGKNPSPHFIQKLKEEVVEIEE